MRLDPGWLVFVDECATTKLPFPGRDHRSSPPSYESSTTLVEFLLISGGGRSKVVAFGRWLALRRTRPYGATAFGASRSRKKSATSISRALASLRRVEGRGSCRPDSMPEMVSGGGAFSWRLFPFRCLFLRDRLIVGSITRSTTLREAAAFYLCFDALTPSGGGRFHIAYELSPPPFLGLDF